MIRLGILDQTLLLPGYTAHDAFKQTMELAQEAEQFGFSRFWVSEHHDSPGIAGSSPEVLLGALGAVTSRIRIGSAGVLLNHYSPYKVAENFRVLEALYPGRVDLGIGRSPGGMPGASRALRYGKPSNSEEGVTAALQDLAGFLHENLPEDHPYSGLQTSPPVDTTPDVWLLGSGTYSAMRAAELGASFSYAHHISPDGGHETVQRYKESFRPGPFGDKPRVNVGIMVMCADTDDEAERLTKPAGRTR